MTTVSQRRLQDDDYAGDARRHERVEHRVASQIKLGDKLTIFRQPSRCERLSYIAGTGGPILGARVCSGHEQNGTDCITGDSIFTGVDGAASCIQNISNAVSSTRKPPYGIRPASIRFMRKLRFAVCASPFRLTCIAY